MKMVESGCAAADFIAAIFARPRGEYFFRNSSLRSAEPCNLKVSRILLTAIPLK
jgi:hypothetical protein